VSSVAVGRSGMQGFVFVVVSSFVIGLGIVGSIIGEASISSALSPLNCGDECGFCSEGMVAGASSIVGFSVISVFVGISVVVGRIVVG